jgi:carboxylate-amine ligase
MKKEQIAGLEFNGGDHELTLGVELELQVLDADTLLLTPKAAEIIESCGDKNIVPEFFQSTIEVTSRICQNAHEIKRI